MPTTTKDPLLIAARILLLLIMGVLGAVAVLMFLVGPAVLIFQDEATAQLATEGITNAAIFLPTLAGLLVGIGVVIAIGIWFFVLLDRIVKSVGEGVPFTLANASRLARMGWISLGVQIATLLLGGAVVWMIDQINSATGPIAVHEDMVTFSPFGLLMTLILFIMARVFRLGAAMRDDLDGTV